MPTCVCIHTRTHTPRTKNLIRRPVLIFLFIMCVCVLYIHVFIKFILRPLLNVPFISTARAARGRWNVIVGGSLPYIYI